MTLSCFILDDEYHAVNILKDFIQKTPGLIFAGASTSPIEAINEIESFRPDIIFMDIDMPDLNGLQVADILDYNYPLIYTTAYREYGFDAFEKKAVDYLLKPISYERFLQCINKTRGMTDKDRRRHAGLSSYFFVKAGTKSTFNRINISEIIYIKGSANYVEIYTNGKKTLTYLTLNEIMEKLPIDDFSRIHKSYIVHHSFIQSFDYGHVNINDDIHLPIGDSYRDDFKTKVSLQLLISRREKS